MKWLAGLVGMLMGFLIFLASDWLSALYPLLLSDPVMQNATALILFTFSLIEIPVMIFGLRQLARIQNLPLFLFAVLAYVAFGAVYGALVVLLTRQIVWGSVFVALMFARGGALQWVN